VRFGPDARLASHELLREGIDGWRVRFVVDGVEVPAGTEGTEAGADGDAGRVPLVALLRWSPADDRWFAWSLEPAVGA
jgi:hypothetical protein